MRGFDLFFQLINIGALFGFAELLLDRLYLLIEIVFALAFLHLSFHAPANALFDLKNVNFRLQQAEQLLEASGHIEVFKNLLLLLQL